MSIFTGSGVAIVTPFDANLNPDFGRLEKLIDWHIESKTDCIVICGTTGEASTLTDEEQLEVINVAVKHTNGRVPVIAGTGSNDTKHGIDLSQNAAKLGVDGLLQVTPYYNKTTQKGLYEHFGAIANSVDVPVVLYNVPSRTGLNILPETANKLSYIDNIVAIKEASGNIVQISNLVNQCEGRLDLYSGNDDQVVPLMSLGAIGVISAAGNVIPTEMHDIVAKFLAGDIKGSLALQMKVLNLIHAIFCEVNPIPAKAALQMMGPEFAAGGCRAPLTSMEDHNLAHLKQTMIDYGFKL